MLHSLLWGIFPIQGSNLGLLHCRQILHYLSYVKNSQISTNNAALKMGKRVQKKFFTKKIYQHAKVLKMLVVRKILIKLQ